MLSRTNSICSLLEKTYNATILESNIDVKNIFMELINTYQENIQEYPKANKSLISLIDNLTFQEQPIVDYITGPAELSKWKSDKYNKIIYMFGEDNHSNTYGCVESTTKKYTNIQTYLIDVFESTPAFIDFYIEFPIMIDKKVKYSRSSGQTLWDILHVFYPCFGPVLDRSCDYNVRMHAIDARRVLGKKYKNTKLLELSSVLMMEIICSNDNNSYISVSQFKDHFKDEIELLSTVNSTRDLLTIITNVALNNKIVMKELSRSTLTQEYILQYFIHEYLKTELNTLKKFFSYRKFRKWFLEIKTSEIWPQDITHVSRIVTKVCAVILDIYTVSRMFKVFQAIDLEHGPQEPCNIIYYAGAGHTSPLKLFLAKLGFELMEETRKNITSCTDMTGIKQPLFS